MIELRNASAVALAGLALALTGCDRPTDSRGSSVAPEAIKAAPNTAQPPLPVNTDVDAAVAETQMKSIAPGRPGQSDNDGADQALNVAAQNAAANAPDTASGDEAKKRVVESGASGSGSTAAKSGKGGPGDELTAGEEATAMPKPGQANDHSAIKRTEK